MTVAETVAIARRSELAQAQMTDREIERYNRALVPAYTRQTQKLMNAIVSGDRIRIQAETKRLAEIAAARGSAMADDFEAMLSRSWENGINLADELTRSYDPASVAAQTTNVPVEAIAEASKDATQRLRNHSEEAARNIQQIVGQSLALGSSPLDIQNALIGQLGILKNRAQNIARTETMTAYNRASKARYWDYGIELVQLLALLDDRTTPECRFRHMKIIRLNESQPPYHFMCRTIPMPFKRDWLTEDDVRFIESEYMKASDGALDRASIFEKQNKIRKPTSVPISRIPIPQRSLVPGAPDVTDYKGLIGYGKQFSDRHLKFPRSIEEIERDLKQLEKMEANDLKLMKKIGSSEGESQKKARQLWRESEKKTRELHERLAIEQYDAMEAFFNSIKREQAKRFSEKDARDLVRTIKFGKMPKDIKKEAQEQLVDFYQFTGGKGRTLKQVVREDSRAYATISKIDINKYYDEPEEIRQVIFHEVGHHVESETGRTHGIFDWLEARSRKGKQKKGRREDLSKYLGESYEGEKAYIGNFVNPYVGKTYGDRGSETEVISVGLEHFNDPARMWDLYRGDPEHFHLTLGWILR